MNYTNRPFSKPYSYEIDSSISDSQFIPYHQKDYEPEVDNIIEFKTDKNNWTYLIINKWYDSLIIFDGKNNWVKRISDDKVQNYIGDIFKNIKSLKFTFIKLGFSDKLCVIRHKYQQLDFLEMSFQKSFIYKVLDMVLKKNEVLDSISVDGTANIHFGLFKMLVSHYVNDINRKRKLWFRKERPRIKISFENVVVKEEPSFKFTAFLKVSDGSIISFDDIEQSKAFTEEPEINISCIDEVESYKENELDNSSKTNEIDDDNNSNYFNNSVTNS